VSPLLEPPGKEHNDQIDIESEVYDKKQNDDYQKYNAESRKQIFRKYEKKYHSSDHQIFFIVHAIPFLLSSDAIKNLHIRFCLEMEMQSKPCLCIHAGRADEGGLPWIGGREGFS
jgi:hypothetical protein